jgi:hypothetical protein
MHFSRAKRLLFVRGYGKGKEALKAGLNIRLFSMVKTTI